MTDVLAFLSLERSLGNLAYRAMYPTVTALRQTLGRTVASNEYSKGRQLAHGLTFQGASDAIVDGGPVLADAAFRLGASVLYGSLNDTPRRITELLDPKYLENILVVHARIVNERASLFIESAINCTLDDLEEEGRGDELAKAEMIAKRPNKDLADRLNAAVDGNAKLMASISANLTVSRLVAFGFLKAARNEGIKNYTLWNPRDERTSAICMELTNPPGHIFKVAFGLHHAEALLNETDPERLKVLAPFLTTGDAKRIRDEGLKTWQLEEQNILIPPFHPFCRTLLIKVGDSIDTDLPHGPILPETPVDLPTPAIASPIVLPTPAAPNIEQVRDAIRQILGTNAKPIFGETSGGRIVQVTPPKPIVAPKPRKPRAPRKPKIVPPAIALPAVNPEGQYSLPLEGGFMQGPTGTAVLKPFIDFQAEVANLKITDEMLWGKDFTPLGKLGGATGINRGAGQLSLFGRNYFVKPVTDDASNVKAEIAAAEIGELLGVNSLPTAAAGKRIVMPFVKYPKAAEDVEGTKRAIQSMSTYEKTRWLVGEYIVGDTDKHRNNYVVDAANNKIYSIDGGRAFNYNHESVFMNVAFNSRVSRNLYAEGEWDRSFKLDVQAIRDNLAQKEAVLNIMKGLGLEDYYPQFVSSRAIEGVEGKFERLEQFLREHPEPTFGQWQRLIADY